VDSQNARQGYKKTIVMEINDLLKTSFEKYLKTLGYAESTVRTSVYYVKDFFFYLKTQQIESLEQIQPATIKGYYEYLLTRSNKKQSCGLSQNTIAINISALKRFSKYLQETGKPFFETNIKTIQDKETHKTILTKAEIKALYKACGGDYFGIRDKAILSIYYGCGLRRSEGQQLDINDILLKEKLVFVRKGKNYKERYVPMTEAIKADLENYIYQARQQFLNQENEKEQALFINYYGKRLSNNGIMERLHKLVKTAQLNKSVGLHSLRHSIATHLLQSGLSLEEVSQFLGHSSLENTQIYTHLAHEISI
jgi:integrase/recombinase XerD